MYIALAHHNYLHEDIAHAHCYGTTIDTCNLIGMHVIVRTRRLISTQLCAT